MKLKFYLFVIAVLLFVAPLFSQKTWSIATDLSAIRNFKDNQEFWSVGHTVKGEIHVSAKDGPYAWVSYFIPGKYYNNFVAVAKSPSTSPQTISFRNKANMSIRQFSIGWKHYFIGGSSIYKDWSLYGIAGFGIMGGKVTNEFQSYVDTSLYFVPVVNGESRFKRLSFDVGAGWEIPLTTELFIYNDFVFWIPASDYPSKYMLNNGKAPLIGSVHIGLRVYFD